MGSFPASSLKPKILKYKVGETNKERILKEFPNNILQSSLFKAMCDRRDLYSLQAFISESLGFTSKTLVLISETLVFISENLGFISETLVFISETLGFISETLGFI